MRHALAATSAIGPLAFTGVYVFGDSLVDSGNVLKLAETIDNLPFTSLPDGAPTAALGYFEGRFSNGYNFADLISNKFVGSTTKPVFPFGFEDPWLGISFPFQPDPVGNNLNFAYGGAQIRQGDESVPDLDDQTDAYRDAADGDADPGALYLITMGGNDVRDLVPAGGSIPSLATATARLENAAAELIEETRQLIEIGVRHVVITGIPDVGIIPAYNDTLNEQAHRDAATLYSTMLDTMIQTQLASLRAAFPAVDIRYVSLTDATAGILANLEMLYDPAELYPLNESELIFFDMVHPTGQAHALLAASILDSMNGFSAGEILPLTAPIASLGGTIGASGETDTLIISLAANRSYNLEMLGLSSGSGKLADPLLSVLGPTGLLVAQDDDRGLGLDSRITFTAAQAGDYTIQLGAVGSLTGSYLFQAAGNAVGDDVYQISHSSALILEGAGGGNDTAYASVSYALAQGTSIETLATNNVRGKTNINLTGNEVDQSVIGNAGNNILDGKAGSDMLRGNAGKDSFAFTTALGAGNVDSILDFVTRDDTILLDDAIFGGLPLGTLASGRLAMGTAAKDSDDRILYDQATGNLYFDPDGNGVLAAVQFATLLGASGKLTAADFVVI